MSDIKKRRKDDFSVPTNAERGHGFASMLVKSVAGFYPGGGLIAAGFDAIFKNPVERRRDRFIMDVDERLAEMERAGLICKQDLEDSEEIAALLLRSLQAASRSIGERKLEALKEIVVAGITAKGGAKAAQTEVMLALVDRMTEYHIVALHWMTLPRRLFTLGQLRDNPEAGARESLFYGQPVFPDPKQLNNPVAVFSYASEFGLYVEHDDRVAFQVAEADLLALGLAEPEYAKEAIQDGRVVRYKSSSTIARYKASALGHHLLSYMGIAAGKPLPPLKVSRENGD